MAEVLPPFSITYSPQIPEWLKDLKCSLAITTYQAGKVVLISAGSNESLSILPRTFEKPMGMSIKDNRIVLASQDQVIIFEGSTELAKGYPSKPDVYDMLYLPTATFHSGRVDIHDIDFGAEDIWAVNTSFSCLCRINGNYNFIPEWKPSFISQLASEDRCHLNGLIMKDGKPWITTALAQSNTPQGWRQNIISGGIMMDVEQDKIVMEGLAMPHSPVYYKNEIYLALSATGKIIKIQPGKWTFEEFANVQGFCRGMDIYKDYLFVATSKLRQNSSTFRQLDIAQLSDKAAIHIYHIPTRALIGSITFQKSVDEIYALKILPDVLRPNIINTDHPAFKLALSIPGKTYWAKEIKENTNQNSPVQQKLNP